MSVQSPISSVNDFVVRFANVNGSGSASANELFARAILRHGVPVSPRNIFPSNIQGLPTWYEVRVTEAGHLGARGGIDMMVAMNPQTWDKDVASIEPGGYLFYDSTKPMPTSKFRADISVIGVPLTAIANSTYTDPRQRQLFKNIIYLGALSALFDMDPKLIEQLIGEQYKGKEKLLSSNVHALHLGRDWALPEFIGLSYFAEIPAVIMNIQRAGPSTGMPTRTQQCDIIACAYASHGDTKHVLLFPEDPAEAFEFAAHSFDLAERLQTTIFLMLDLDIGMNHRLSRPLKWDDARQYDRGKVMTAEMLDEGRDFGRYLDVDGDGIPYRTYPGTHPTKGSYFTRGTSRDRYARYSEEGPVYADNMQRLVRKFETAQDMVPRPLQANARKPSKYGVIYFGSTAPAMDEAIELFEARGHELDRLRIRAFPFHSSVASFIADHDFVYVVEPNRDAQLRSLIVNENGIDPVRLVPILHYDGTPITARFIANSIGDHQDHLKVSPLRKVKS